MASTDWIERRPGIDIHNTDRIIPELQHLTVGGEVAMPGYTMRVERLDPQQAMVIRSSNHAWVWSLELRPANGHTRLISRNRFDLALLPVKDKLMTPVMEPGSWVMERKMLRTIKQRAEFRRFTAASSFILTTARTHTLSGSTLSQFGIGTGPCLVLPGP